MIGAIGLSTDKTFARFALQSKDSGFVDIRIIDLLSLAEGEWHFDCGPTALGYVIVNGEKLNLSLLTAVYCRPIDISSQLPVKKARRWRHMLSAANAWLDAAPIRVVNRPSAGVHNGTKPLHEFQLATLGFKVPRSITTSDRIKLRRFVRTVPSIVKAISGVRCRTQRVTVRDFDSYIQASGPVHLQEYVEGDDVRVHVVGRKTLALRIRSGVIDYRSAGSAVTYEHIRLDASFRARLVASTRSLGLDFAGWDFKLDKQGNFACLEANPMPGYGFYDSHCAGAISQALLTYLMSGT